MLRDTLQKKIQVKSRISTVPDKQIFQLFFSIFKGREDQILKFEFPDFRFYSKKLETHPAIFKSELTGLA